MGQTWQAEGHDAAKTLSGDLRDLTDPEGR